MYVVAAPNLFGLWIKFRDEDTKFPSGFIRIPIVAWMFSGSDSSTPVPAFRQPDNSEFAALELTCGGVIWRHKRYLHAEEWFAECRKTENDRFSTFFK